MKKGMMTILEITDTHIKWVQARVQRGEPMISLCLIKRLDRVAETPLQEEQKGAVAAVLSKIIPAKEKESTHPVVIIPRRFIIQKQVALPSLHEEEVRRMIDLQLVNHIPYPRGEVIYDFSVLEKDPTGYTKILLTVVHRDVIQYYLDILNKAGLAPQRFVLSSFGLIDWFNRQGQKKKDKETKALTVLMNMDSHSTEICFCDNGRLVFSRNINFGARDCDEKNPLLMEQINLTIGAYRKEHTQREMQQVMIIASTRKAPFLQERLKENYHVPVDVLEPFQNIRMERNLDLKSCQDEEVSMAASLGLLFSDPHKQINLLPEEVLDTKRSRLKRKVWAQFILTAVAALILGTASLGVGIYQDSLYLKKIEVKATQSNTLRDKAAEKIQFLRFIKVKLQNRIFIADMIMELFALTPPTTSFRSLKLGSNGVLVLQGFTEEGSAVNLFQNELVRSSMFKDVKLQYERKQKRLGEEYTDFEITCKLAEREDVIE